MAIKIENVAIVPLHKATGAWAEMCKAVGALKVGESFLIVKTGTNHASFLTAIGYAMNRKFSQRKEGEQIRIGRIA